MSERFSKVTKIQEVIALSNRLSIMPSDSYLLAKLDRGIKSMLSGQLAEHCQIGKIENNILVYYVDSPIWAYTFKMSKVSILSALHGLAQTTKSNNQSNQQVDWTILSQIEDIHIRVRPSIKRPKRYAKPRAPLPKFSQEIGKSIEMTADTLEDPELAELWRNFARKHARQS